MLVDSAFAAAVSCRFENNYHYIIYALLYQNKNAALLSVKLQLKNT